MSDDKGNVAYVAVKGTFLIFIVVISLVISFAGVFYTAHQIGNIKGDSAKEIGDIKSRYGELKGRVDANEDDIVDFQKARDNYFYEKITAPGKKGFDDGR